MQFESPPALENMGYQLPANNCEQQHFSKQERFLDLHYPLPSNMRTIGTTLATVGAALFLLCVFVPHYTVAVKLYATKNPLVLVYDLPYGLH